MMEISPVIVTVILGLTYFDISNKILYFNFIRKKFGSRSEGLYMRQPD